LKVEGKDEEFNTEGTESTECAEKSKAKEGKQVSRYARNDSTATQSA